MDQNQRYAELFREESFEQIESLNQQLLRLEKEGPAPDIIDEIFRVAHTLKSSSAFVGLDALSDLSHRMEDLLQKLREHTLAVTTETVTLLFQCLDRIRRGVENFQPGIPEADNYKDLITAIAGLARAGSHGATAAQPAKVSSAPASASPAGDPAPSSSGGSSLFSPDHAIEVSVNPEDLMPAQEAPAAAQQGIVLTAEEERELLKESAGHEVFEGMIRLEPDAPMKNMRFLLLLQHLSRAGRVYRSVPDDTWLESAPETRELRFLFWGQLPRQELIRLCQIDMVEEVRIVARAEKTHHEESRYQSRSIKVSSEKIDYLMNSVGELVITNSGLLKVFDDLRNAYGENTHLTELKNRIDQAARIARDLQSGIMKTRMIPIGLAFHRFTRPARDLALELGKEVELTFHGEDTELDKNIIDAIHEPLLHLLRNSMDHGIEKPDERAAAGKPRVGSIVLTSYQSGNHIFVDIEDDGKGLSREGIWKRAQASGLAQSAEMPDDDTLYNFIFEPGFSTADQVTDVSGRGVGMNVVRQMVQDFNGSIQIHTVPGEGTRFTLSFPLTLAIISAILVQVSGEEYAFPLSDVVETVRIARDEVTTLHGRDIVSLRGEILPLYQTGPLLGGYRAQTDTPDFPIMIASTGGRKAGFVVDALHGKAEIVIKSLEKNFRQIRGLVGVCLMGDGRIVPVLDVQGLSELAQRDSKRDPSVRALEYLSNMDLDSTAATHKYNDAVTQLLSRRKGKDRKVTQQPPSAQTALTARPVSTVGTPTRAAADDHHASSSDIHRPHREETPAQPARPEASGKPPESAPLRPENAAASSNSAGQTAAEEEPVEEVLDPSVYNRLQVVINSGMVSAGMVLSQLLGIKVEVSVPEFHALAFPQLAAHLPTAEAVSVELGTEEGMEAHLYLVFDLNTAIQAAGELMGLPQSDWNSNKISREDLSSVLCELMNIVGASILNSMANKAGRAIKPSVPGFFMGTGPEISRRIQGKVETNRDLRLLYISADFFREGMDLIGRMFFLSPSAVIDDVVGGLR